MRPKALREEEGLPLMVHALRLPGQAQREPRERSNCEDWYAHYLLLRPSQSSLAGGSDVQGRLPGARPASHAAQGRITVNVPDSYGSAEALTVNTGHRESTRRVFAPQGYHADFLLLISYRGPVLLRVDQQPIPKNRYLVDLSSAKVGWKNSPERLAPGGILRGQVER